MYQIVSEFILFIKYTNLIKYIFCNAKVIEHSLYFKIDNSLGHHQARLSLHTKQEENKSCHHTKDILHVLNIIDRRGFITK